MNKQAPNANRVGGSQGIDKTNGVGQLGEGFGQAFSKACAVEAAQASSPSAEGEMSPSAFSFASFSLAPPSCKRKAAKELVQADKSKKVLGPHAPSPNANRVGGFCNKDYFSAVRRRNRSP